MCWYKNKTILSLDGYKEEIFALNKLAEKELIDRLSENEILTVFNQYRDDNDLVSNGVLCRTFRNTQNMFAFIRKASGFFEDCDSEPLIDRMWWYVVRYRLTDGEYCEYMRYWFSIECNLLGYTPVHKFQTENLSASERELLEGGYLFQSPHNVILPYKTGDILKINMLPFTKPVYIAYGGSGPEDAQETMDDTYEHWCIYLSEDRNGLDISDLCNSWFLDYGHNPFSSIGNCQKVTTCPEPLLTRVSDTLKQNPDLWLHWFALYHQHMNSDSGGLEQWFFPHG